MIRNIINIMFHMDAALNLSAESTAVTGEQPRRSAHNLNTTYESAARIDTDASLMALYTTAHALARVPFENWSAET